MRVSDKMRFEQAKDNIGKNRSQMSELQNQASTQKRVTKPSDDPLAAARVLSSRIDLQGNKQFTKNLNYARSFLEYTDQSLGDLSELLMRAKELAINQSSDASANEESRRVVATEIEQLGKQMVAIGNRKLGDRFIFGGFRTQQAPFASNGKYRGDFGEMNIHVDKENFIAMNVPGSRVFLGEGIDSHGVSKQGIQQPRTIEEFESKAMEGKIKVPSSADPIENQPAVMNRGPASVGPGQAPADEMAQGAVQPDQTSGSNLFRVMQDLEIALRTNDKVAVQDTLDTLDTALEQVVLTRASVGSRASTLDGLIQTIEKAKVDNKTQISSLEDADIFSTVSDINKTESTLQATLQTSSKLINQSLLDFLR